MDNWRNHAVAVCVGVGPHLNHPSNFAFSIMTTVQHRYKWMVFILGCILLWTKMLLGSKIFVLKIILLDAACTVIYGLTIDTLRSKGISQNLTAYDRRVIVANLAKHNGSLNVNQTDEDFPEIRVTTRLNGRTSRICLLSFDRQKVHKQNFSRRYLSLAQEKAVHFKFGRIFFTFRTSPHWLQNDLNCIT